MRRIWFLLPLALLVGCNRSPADHRPPREAAARKPALGHRSIPAPRARQDPSRTHRRRAGRQPPIRSGTRSAPRRTPSAVLDVLQVPNAPGVQRLDRARAAKLPLISVPAHEVMAWARRHCRVQYYGLYLQGNKLGWARMGCRIIQRRGRPLLERLLQATMEAQFYGRAIHIDIAWRQRWRQDGTLLRLSYLQRTSQQEKRTEARRVGSMLQVTQSLKAVGTHMPSTRKQVAARILDLSHSELAFVMRLVTGKVPLGFGYRYADFDPDRSKPYHAASVRLGTLRRVLQGVPVILHKVQTLDLDRGLDSISLLDGDGAQVDGRIQGTIRLRREERAAALAPSAGRTDFGLGMVVPVQMPPLRPDQVTRLRLRLSGYLPKGLNAPGRQRLRRLGPRSAELTLQRDSLADLPQHTLPIRSARLRKWLEPEPGIESRHAEIRALATSALRGTRNALQAARRLTAFVFHYLKKRLSTNLDSALAIARARAGDCTEHARLLVALCRAAGLPAREVAGLTWAPSLGGLGYHAWTQVWLGRWIDADPSWNELPVNATHILMSREKDEQWLGTLGTLRATVLEVVPESRHTARPSAHRPHMP